MEGKQKRLYAFLHDRLEAQLSKHGQDEEDGSHQWKWKLQLFFLACKAVQSLNIHIVIFESNCKVFIDTIQHKGLCS